MLCRSTRRFGFRAIGTKERGRQELLDAVALAPLMRELPTREADVPCGNDIANVLIDCLATIRSTVAAITALPNPKRCVGDRGLAAE